MSSVDLMSLCNPVRSVLLCSSVREKRKRHVGNFLSHRTDRTDRCLSANLWTLPVPTVYAYEALPRSLPPLLRQPRWGSDRLEKGQIKTPSHDIYTVYSWQFDNILLLLHRFSEWKLRGACLFGLAEIIPIDLIRIMPS